MIRQQSYRSSVVVFDPVYRKSFLTPPQMVDPLKGMPKPDAPFTDEPCLRFLPDGSAELSCFLPEANAFTAMIYERDERIEFKKGEDGYFRAIIPNLAPGFRYISFMADHIPYLHPQLPIGYGFGKAVNYIDLPGMDFAEMQDVPHGKLQREVYYSEVANRMRAAWVYTPPGYENAKEKHYPVLYIQHGGGENEADWFFMGRVNWILDNLLAEGKVQEMIIVANHGNAYRENPDGTFTEVDAASVIMKDCIPFIDMNYRTIPEAYGRAVAGLSMGGGQARHMAHGHPELFKNVAVFSSGQGFMVSGASQGDVFDYSELFSSPEYYKERFDVTFVACGLEDMRHEYTKEHVQALRDKGFDVVYKAYPGGHEWNVWRMAIKDFMEMIFHAI